MNRRLLFGTFAAVVLLLAVSTGAWAAPLLSSFDPIIAIDTDYSDSFWGRRDESPASLLDGDTATKYGNKGEENSGFIVTPAYGSSAVQGFVLTTAADHEDRDPVQWKLYGTDDPIASKENSLGNAETWGTEIASGLDAGFGTGMTDFERETDGAFVSFTNATSYTSYRMVFPTVKDPGVANSMTISRAFFYTDTPGIGDQILASGDPIIAIDTDVRTTSQCLIGGGGTEGPGNLLDGDTSTMFGAEYLHNVGFIVTLDDAGASVVKSFQLTTDNEIPYWGDAQDPSSWELYGTDDPITSENESFGDQEDWTFIDSGELDLPVERETAGPLVEVVNDTAYTSYKMVFPTIKNPWYKRSGVFVRSMQISECQFYDEYNPPDQIPGDATGDGNVDELDAQRLAENWGATEQNVNYDTWWEMGDFDNDESIGPADAAIMAANWGYTSEEGTEGVPEPSVGAMILSLMLVTFWRRRVSY